MKASPDPNVTLISQNAVEVVRGLRSEAGKGQQSALQLVDSKVYGNGVVLLRYRLGG